MWKIFDNLPLTKDVETRHGLAIQRKCEFDSKRESECEKRGGEEIELKGKKTRKLRKIFIYKNINLELYIIKQDFFFLSSHKNI